MLRVWRRDRARGSAIAPKHEWGVSRRRCALKSARPRLLCSGQQEVVCKRAVVEAQLPHISVREALQWECSVQTRHGIL